MTTLKTVPAKVRTGTVAAISSFVMRGAVGLRASQFALERRGHTVWPIPTVLLPWHPGLGRSTRTLPPDFAVQLAEIATHAPSVDAVFTGYFAAPEQVAAAATFIDTVRNERPDVVVLVDPVMGDDNGRYVPDAVAETIREMLLPRADIITPNGFELSDLTGEADPERAAAATGVRTVVGTSHAAKDGRIGTSLWRAKQSETVWHDAIDPAPRGTGDLFAAVFLAAVLEGLDDRRALAEAAGATLTVCRASDGETLALQAAQDAIASPPLARVQLERSIEPKGSGAVHGVDGCPGGYAVVTLRDGAPRAWLCTDIAELIGRRETLAIDIPIGLPDTIEGSGRVAEQAVRPALGPRKSSVFSIPGRAAVYAQAYEDACAAALASSKPPRSISKQAFMIFPKIREVDQALNAERQDHVFECHAEIAFWRLNGEKAMDTAKAATGVPAAQQLESRIALLCERGLPRSLFESKVPGVPLVDLVDAAAIALIAERCADGSAAPFPNPPGRDSRGLRVAIWA